MQKRLLNIILTITLSLLLIVPISVSAEDEKVVTSNQIGKHDGYDYELWKDNGDSSMTLKDGGTFNCNWSNINNVLFRKGKKFNETQTYKEIGNISFTYECDYNPDGNSYMCIYGWTTSPLVEYYIVESWGTWRPPGASSKGQINIDGGVYDVYETVRTNQPSIKGTQTFKQYWSVRTEKRTSGTVSVSEHFQAWENMGLTMGNMYEAAFTIEGYQSNGTANILKNNISITEYKEIDDSNVETKTDEEDTTSEVADSETEEIEEIEEIVLNNNCNLSKLKINKGELNKKFSKNKTSYTLTLSEKQKKVKITPTIEDKSATYTINGKDVKSLTVNVSSKKSKTVSIKVTAENGDSKTYKIVVKRK